MAPEQNIFCSSFVASIFIYLQYLFKLSDSLELRSYKNNEIVKVLKKNLCYTVQPMIKPLYLHCMQNIFSTAF